MHLVPNIIFINRFSYRNETLNLESSVVHLCSGLAKIGVINRGATINCGTIYSGKIGW